MKNKTHMGVKNILFMEFVNNKQQETSTIICDVQTI